jgi:2',3'-cyclic-nucleotide 2'-phosphodiesterase (5'-nucleotidase family)
MRPSPPPIACRLAAVLLAVLPSACLGPDRPEAAPVTILFTSDLHSAFRPGRDGRGGLARVAGYAADLRGRQPGVLLLDGGDAVSGTPTSSLAQGRPAFQLMSLAGYDAMAVGNHEFDHGWRLLSAYRSLATFPLLSANIEGPGGEPLADAAYVVLDADGVRVGVIGLTPESTPDFAPPVATEGCAFHPAAPALAALLPEVRERADVVVVLSHLGLAADRSLAQAVPGADVILGGHSHERRHIPERIGGTLLAHAGDRAQNLVRVDLEVDLARGRLRSAEASMVRVDDAFPVDGIVAAAVAAWEESVRERVSAPVAEFAQPVAQEEVVRLAAEAYRKALGADLGFQNAAAVQCGLPAGRVTLRDVWEALPFENTLATVRVRGDRFPDWALREVPAPDPGRVYTVATTAYVAAHAERFFRRGIESVEGSDRSARDAVVEHLRTVGRPK